ncbi:MAG: low molecular weight phosphatase family protein [Acidimicrobiia bacterium]
MNRPTVMFVCVHNAGRSQMAAAWLRRLAGDQVTVLAGGSEPADRVNEAVVDSMGEVGIDVSGEHPQPWSTEDIRAADVVVTMGCGDSCPIFPGKRYLDWEVEDPAGQTPEGVRSIRDEIESRVRQLMADLGLVTVASPG